MKPLFLIFAVAALVGCAREKTSWDRPESGEVSVAHFVLEPHSERIVSVKSELPLRMRVARKFDASRSEEEQQKLSFTIRVTSGLIEKLPPATTEWSGVCYPTKGVVELKLQSEDSRAFEVAIGYTMADAKKEPNQTSEPTAPSGRGPS